MASRLQADLGSPVSQLDGELETLGPSAHVSLNQQ